LDAKRANLNQVSVRILVQAWPPTSPSPRHFEIRDIKAPQMNQLQFLWSISYFLDKVWKQVSFALMLSI
jgi:hypothetical protein